MLTVIFPSQLSEAYCLLWQHSNTGEVVGRQNSKQKIGGAVCAVLLDLIAMEKIKIEQLEEKKFLFLNYTEIWVRVSVLVLLSIITMSGCREATLKLL